MRAHRQRDRVVLEMRPGPPFGSVLEVPDWEDVRIRVVTSPMHTLVVGILEIIAGRDRGTPSRWTQTVLSRARDLDLSPLELYVAEIIRIPDFFMPATSFPTFEEQLDALAATPADVIRADLEYEYGDELPSTLIPWARDPPSALAAYCRALREWWEAVLKPSWTPIRSALEAEISRLGRLLATRPPAEALPGIHPRLVVTGETLTVDGGPNFERHRLGRRSILLVPMAAGDDAILTAFDHRDGAVIAMTAPGMHELLAGEAQEPDAHLAALLGEARARIVLHMDSAVSTIELATVFGYAPSTVSEHLRSLSVMGLVQSSRHGRFVFYERTERGQRLVEIYAP